MVSPTDLDEAADLLPLLLPPPLPEPGPGGEPLASRGHPGGPGFADAGTPGDTLTAGSVWQRTQAVWQTAGAEWSSAAPAAPVTRRPRAPRLHPVPALRARWAHWPARTRRWCLTAAVIVLIVAVAGGGYAWRNAGRLGPRAYPAAQAAQFGAGPGSDTGAGVSQSLTQVTSSGDTVVAAGGQAGGDLTRAQFYVSADAGASWQLAPVRTATGGDPAPGHPAQLMTAGPDGWLAAGPHAIWTSPNARAWTLASTTGITPTDTGDQVQVLIRTAVGYLAAGQNPIQGAGLIWTSPDGLHWHRETAAQPLLPGYHGQIVSITGAVAHGPDILLSGQVDPWYESAGPHNNVTWLSTDGGSTWRAVSVPASNGAARGLTGIASAGAGFVAVRPAAVGQGGIVYASANGSSWHYVTTLSSANGLKLTAVDGGPGGFSVLAQGSRSQLFGFTSTDGTHWKKAASFGPAPGTTTGSTVTAHGALIAAGVTGTPAGQQPFLAVAAPGQDPRNVSVGHIAGTTISGDRVTAVASAGRQQVVVGERDGTLATWSGTSAPAAGAPASGTPATGTLASGTWDTAEGQPPAVAGTQRLTSVTHGPDGWLATGYALTGGTTHPVAATSPDGHTWQLAPAPALTSPGAVAVQTAAGPDGYVVAGRATTGAGTVPAVWWSASLQTWTHARIAATPGQILGLTSGASVTTGATGTAGTGGFVAVGTAGIDPAVWTSANGRQWAAHQLQIPGTGARAQLSEVAARGRTVVAFGEETWASGRQAPFAEVSHDGGRTWTPVPFTASARGTAGSPATVTAVTAMSDGFTAVGTYGPAGDRDVVVWTSPNGDGWLTQTPAGPGLSGPGIQQLSGLTATGTALTGVGFTATPTTEHPTLWRVPAR